tara:strand:- start:471 stop:1016 length:546 start_codon:yes stop_codon:yes gene_type:complete
MIQYIPDFLEDAGGVFKYLMTHVPWEQKEIRVFGKTHFTPRKTAWYSKDGKSYSYSNISQKTHPYCEVIDGLNSRVESFLGLEFNSVLLNLYEDGSHKVGWHSDNEKELGDEINIASISLGASRDFKYRPYNDKGLVKTLPLEHGSLLVMRHPFQLNHEHCVPPRRKVVNSRINLTFRSIL